MNFRNSLGTRALQGLALLAVASYLASPCWAHQSTNSYLILSVAKGEVLCQWDVALADLQHVLAVDDNHDGIASPREFQAHEQQVWSYVLTHLKIFADQQLKPLEPADDRIGFSRQNTYAVFYLVAAVPLTATNLAVAFDAIFALDPSHRSLARLEWAGKTHTAVFTATNTRHTFSPNSGGWQMFWDFVREGTWHIWIGYDHILFLLALLLPSVLAWREGTWEPALSFASALREIIKVVTAFTVAHSLTLSLAVWGWVQPPSRWVEVIIAASVALAALNNLRPIMGGRGWMLAFGFGLIHGFGFANVLSGLELRKGSLAVTLAGFNIGVELGQLVIVGLFFPVAYYLRKTLFYRVVVLRGISLLVCLIALLWIMERVYDVKLLPF